MKECFVNITKKHTTSVRRGLLALAAFALIGFGIASCGETPDGGNPGDPNNNNNNNNNNNSGGDTPYTISLKEAYGITASPSTAKKGDKVTLTVADRDGYAFDGWTVVKPAGLKIESDDTFTMPEGAVEITAKWKEGAYNITVNSGGAPGVAADKKSAQENETVTLTRSTYEGYTFVKWEVVKPQGLTITAGDDDTYTYTFTMPAAKVEVTAVWKLTDYNIIVTDGTGGSGSSAKPTTANIDDTVQLSPGTAAAGYMFDKWTVVNPDGLAIEENNTFTMPASEVEVTATWKLIEYSITVHADGGSGTEASKDTANVGNEITLSRGTKEGYTFVKWVTEPQDVNFTGDDTFTMPPSNVEVTATWKANNYTITVKDSTGGSGTVVDKTTAIIRDAVKLTLGTPDAGYTFDTWTVVKPDGLAIGADGAFTMPASDVVVTATWKLIDYTITVNQGEGSGSSASKSIANVLGTRLL